MASESSTSAPFSLQEVMALSDIDLVEKFSLITRNPTLRSRITLEYKCMLLGNCSNVTYGRRAKQEMVRHLRSHLKDICCQDSKQKQHSQSGLGVGSFYSFHAVENVITSKRKRTAAPRVTGPNEKRSRRSESAQRLSEIDDRSEPSSTVLQTCDDANPVSQITHPVSEGHFTQTFTNFVRTTVTCDPEESYEDDVDEGNIDHKESLAEASLDCPPEPKYDGSMVKIWDIFHPSGTHFVPSACPANWRVASTSGAEQPVKCIVQKWGRRRYLRFYYATGPITTSVQRFRCSTCETVFSALDPAVIAQYPVGAYCTNPLLSYGCTFVDLEFFERLYSLQRETYNANLVVETAHRDWKIHYMFQKRQYLQRLQSFLCRKKSNSSVVFEKFPQIPRTFHSFNRQFWVRLVLDVNHNLATELQAKLDVLAKWQSRRLSIDHTFRVVKNVVAFVGNEQRSDSTSSKESGTTNEQTDGEQEETEITIEDGHDQEGDDDDDDDDEDDDSTVDPNCNETCTRKQRKRTVHLAYAELFVVNENGMVVGFEHCKDKSFEAAKPALQRIWSVQHPNVETRVVWTDDVRADERNIKACYRAYKPQSSVTVGQDSFHVCEQRIMREVSKKHQDFTIFRTIIKGGFRKFHQGEGWLNEEEFKSWLLNCAEDFSHPTSLDLNDEELIQTVASLEESCPCNICQKVNSFLKDPQQLALLVSCSRKERHHVYRCLAGNGETVHHENHGQGIMIKKMSEHPHACSHQNYFEVLGRQVVNQVSAGSHYVPMSGDGLGDGVVTKKAKDVIKNQTDDAVVRGLWAHYSAKNLGLLGTTVNERFHKFANAKLKGIRIMGWDLFCLYIMWLIEDWNQLHSPPTWVTQLPDDTQNPFPDPLEDKLLQMEKDLESIAEGNAPYQCVRYVPSREKATFTPEGLVAAGIPVNLDKFRWTAKAAKELKTVVKELHENRSNRPPTKSILKYVKENICGGCGPSEDQIRKKLRSTNYFAWL